METRELWKVQEEANKIFQQKKLRDPCGEVRLASCEGTGELETGHPTTIFAGVNQILYNV